MYVGPCGGYCKHPSSFQSVIRQKEIMEWLFQYYKNMYRKGRTDLNRPPFWGEHQNKEKLQAYAPTEWGHRLWNPIAAGYPISYPNDCIIFLQNEECYYSITDTNFDQGTTVILKS